MIFDVFNQCFDLGFVLFDVLFVVVGLLSWFG